MIVDIILEMVPTTQLIVLYGSFARGDWVKDRTNEDGVVYEYCSDFDIMVTTEDKASARNDRLWQRVEDRYRKSDTITKADLGLPANVPFFQRRADLRTPARPNR